jgi:glucosamine--fructose-6-phosphate aminotransferase (isomerizing)
MCGIMGYVGERPISKDVILDGLKALEYRGYDSAGIVIIDQGKLWSEKRAGKLDVLVSKIDPKAPQRGTALGHTRWATHGGVTDENAHPHFDCQRRIAVIHNGIIENYSEIKAKLLAEGHEFRSETDTEVLAHLFEKLYKGNLEEAVRAGLKRLKGAYAIGVISIDAPDEIVVAKTASPLVIGLGKKENFLASGIPALLPHTKQMIFLRDQEMAVIRKDSIKLCDFCGKELEQKPELIHWDPITTQKMGFKHFMLKEINEQPLAVANTLHGCIDLNVGGVRLDGIKFSKKQLENLKNITMIACGTAYHAAWTAKYLWQRHLNLPIGVEVASEFRYSSPYLSKETLVIAISQSGETADTLAGVKLAKERGAPVLAITNTPGSAISREADQTFYTQAGPEIGVASTKCFLAQLAALALFELYLGQHRATLDAKTIREKCQTLLTLPTSLEKVLTLDSKIQEIANQFYTKRDFLFFGRDILCPMAFEGALKLKEISYIHAEAYAAGEMKHGPIALVDENMPVVFLVTRNSVYEKIFSNMEEIKARKGIIIAITDEVNTDIERVSQHIIELPKTDPLLTPMLFSIPMQLLAYHVGVLRGTDVDQPRNLAKSVTVE